MDETNESWCLIESDPGVFWDLSQRLGVVNADFEEILSLDESFLRTYEEIFGLIFLFRWHPDLRPTMNALGAHVNHEQVYFVKQVIQNSCATQALLSVLLNQSDKIQIGSMLEEFKMFAQALDPEMGGFALANHEVIRDAHNAFRQIHSLSIKEHNRDKPREDAFHFVAIVPDELSKSVHLLDGLRDAPICIGHFELYSDWYRVAIPAITKIISGLDRIPRTDARPGEIRFNLIAITPDLTVRREMELNHLKQNLTELFQEQVSSRNDDSTNSASISSRKECVERIQTIIERIREIRMGQEEASARKQKWVEENFLRVQDLVPFYLCCLRHLGRRRLLTPTYLNVLLSAKS